MGKVELYIHLLVTCQLNFALLISLFSMIGMRQRFWWDQRELISSISTQFLFMFNLTINAHDLLSKDSITRDTSCPIRESSDKEIRDKSMKR